MVDTTSHAGTLPASGSFLSVDADHVVVEAVKHSDRESGALVIRLYEAWGQRGPVTVQLPWEPARVARADLLEGELGELPFEDRAVTFDISPFEIVTLVVNPAG
jgi:alpha-mannosidase